MGNLNEDIFSYACDSVIPCLEVIRKSIVMEEISCNAGSLCCQSSHRPRVQLWIWLRRKITSIAACILIPPISAPARFCLLLMWWIWLSSITENTPSKMSYNTCLAAVMNLTSAYNMGTNMLLIPSFIGSLADAVAFCLSSVFVFPL